MKRLFSCLLALLFLITAVNGYYYNDTYSNLSIKQNGWCIDIETEFKVYNETEYDLYKDDSEYDEYANISSAVIKLYSGPFDSMPLLLDSTTSATGEFSYTFTTANDYLLEIYPTGYYNDYYELIAIEECKYSNPALISNSTSTTTTTILYDKSYLYTDIKILLNDTDMLSEKNLTVKNINGIVQNGLTALENVVKSFSVTGVNTNFSNMDIEISLVSIDTNNITKGYLYENNSWTEKTIVINENKVTFQNSKYGIYAITSNAIPTIESTETPISETPEIVETSSEQTSNAPTSQNDATTEEVSSSAEEIGSADEIQTESSSSSFMYIVVGIVIILVLGVGGYMATSKKKPVVVAPQNEVLNSYNEIYSHAKKYVQTYKDAYGKDQIYRALENVNVPRDIIDKVFLEEYN